MLPKIAYAETLWVQVPQWSDDWEKCAVDVPDSACHWYVANADNTFGEGFDWESEPWYSAEGLKDVAPMQKETVVQKLQNVGLYAIINIDRILILLCLQIKKMQSHGLQQER